MRDPKEDFEAEFDQFSRSLAWSDAVWFLLSFPVLVLLLWWLLQR